MICTCKVKCLGADGTAEPECACQGGGGGNYVYNTVD